MTRNDTLQCVHEPFGDAYYFGPERLAERYESDPQARKESGYSQSTYRTIFDRIAKENSEVRKMFYFPSFSSGDSLRQPILASLRSIVPFYHMSRVTTKPRSVGSPSEASNHHVLWKRNVR
jgi:hypothetical protein